MTTIDLFLIGNKKHTTPESEELKIFNIVSESEIDENQLNFNDPFSTKCLKMISEKTNSPFVLFQVKPGKINIDFLLLKLITEDLNQSESNFAYSDFVRIKNETETSNPTSPYQPGSIRDDFDFGPVVLIKTSYLKQYFETSTANYKYAGWYDIRLFLTRISPPLHSNLSISKYEEIDFRLSGQKQFDYVNPQNRARQIELEQAATFHLEKIGAKVSPPFKEVNFDADFFEFEASVIIPVLNREKTITDAIESVLSQQTNFPFNLIIIDNHSSDDTSKIISKFNDGRIIHHIPNRNDLGIGGCWNEGIQHPNCGRFAIQLDSDDLYINNETLQKIVDKFRLEKCAMVIGSYQMVNFKLEELPPGVIDHKEWTDDNGPNNALRINGLGAPRAFYTPLIRKIEFPNVSYGEDYAVGIALSREYKIGRIYDPLYLCRRWDENTDSNLSIGKMNAHNWYKDSLRTEEIRRRETEKKEKGERRKETDDYHYN